MENTGSMKNKSISDWPSKSGNISLLKRPRFPSGEVHQFLAVELVNRLPRLKYIEALNLRKHRGLSSLDLHGRTFHQENLRKSLEIEEIKQVTIPMHTSSAAHDKLLCPLHVRQCIAKRQNHYDGVRPHAHFYLVDKGTFRPGPQCGRVFLDHKVIHFLGHLT